MRYIGRSPWQTAAVVAALSGLALLAPARQAQANQTFQFQNVSLHTNLGAPAGTLTGIFTTNDALTSLLSYDITASQNLAAGFLGFEYTPANSTVSTQALPSNFSLFSSSGILNIVFQVGGLTTSGATLEGASNEIENGTPRDVGSGSTVNVAPPVAPEPGSLALLLVAGLPLAGTIAYKRR